MMWKVLVLVFHIVNFVGAQNCSAGFIAGDRCSSNVNCGFLPYAGGGQSGACGLIASSSCAQMAECTSHFTCSQPNTMCVKHPGCNLWSVCYPLDMAGENVCPSPNISE
jgi:hypothetical protein